MSISSSPLTFLFVGLLFSLFSPAALQAQTSAPPPDAPQESSAQPQNVEVLSEQQKDEFRNRMMSKLPQESGCFEAQPSSNNNSVRKSVPCLPAPKSPSPLVRKQNIIDLTVGAATDDVAQVAGTISSVTGSFATATGITEISSPIYQDTSRTVYRNTYSLQINSNSFPTNSSSACANVSTCRGWQQFIFSQRSGCAGTACVYIEYWLFDSPSCPSDGASGHGCSCPGSPWNPYSDPSGNTASGCFFNTQATGTGTPSVADFGKLKFVGQTNVSGNDVVTLQTADGVLHSRPYAANTLDLGNAWTGAEFNVVGDCCAYETFFNAGSNMTVQIGTTSTQAPTCFLSAPNNWFNGSTAETNNLSLVPNSCNKISPSAIAFAQSGGGDPGGSGYTIGDPHLVTINGLHYDFQSTGDFLVLEDGPQFIVQARHKALNASVSGNAAVAAKLGDTSIAVCLPNQLEVNGTPTTLADGHAVAFGSILVSRKANVYEIIGPGAATIRAEMTPSYINMYVVPGSHDREKAHGLLSGFALKMPDGTTLSKSPSYKDFIAFSRSWLVNSTESLICKTPTAVYQSPAKPISANDLDPKERERVQRICSEAGVRDNTLLGDCMLDVSVLGEQKSVIEPFQSVRAPSSHVTPTFP